MQDSINPTPRRAVERSTLDLCGPTGSWADRSSPGEPLAMNRAPTHDENERPLPRRRTSASRKSDGGNGSNSALCHKSTRAF